MARIENLVLRLDAELAEARRIGEEAARRLPSYLTRLDVPFREKALLDEKRTALADLEADLAATSGAGEEEAPANDDMPMTDPIREADSPLRDAA